MAKYKITNVKGIGCLSVGGEMVKAEKDGSFDLSKEQVQALSHIYQLAAVGEDEESGDSGDGKKLSKSVLLKMDKEALVEKANELEVELPDDIDELTKVQIADLILTKQG